MSSKNLLVELFVEELPPKALKKLGESFSNVLFETLKMQGLTADNSSVTSFASPRRLAAHITDIASKAADKQVAQKLMPASVGLDANGKATPALVKKLASLGADESAVAQLRKENDGKADILFFDALQPGANLSEGLQKAIEESIEKLPIPKVMTYQLQDDTENPGWDSVNFVRPAHGLVALHGSDVIDISVLGLKSGKTTQGHRFEAKVSPVQIKDADSYAEQLRIEGAVIASFEERRAEIVRQLAEAAGKQNLKPIDDDALLDEVTALVERPNVLLGQFENEYLEVPQECLILTMKSNQKYFPLLDSNDKLTNKFLIVSNISPADPSKVIGGNERVVRPRLADAKFFYDQDRKKTLESRVAGLDKVVYHNKLGSQGERILRVRAIAKAIGQELGGEKLAQQADQAAMLAKADLLTDMVGEFPELQGIMGRYYAHYESLDEDVALAIEDHYKPRFAGDELPRNQVGVCVALADKLETLVGMFGIGNIPTGDKDPFALRRHAGGLARIIIEKNLPLKLNELLKDSRISFAATVYRTRQELTKSYDDTGNKIVSDISITRKDNALIDPLNDSEQVTSLVQSISDFVYERLQAIYRDQGFSSQEFESVISLTPALLSQVGGRLEAVKAFSSLEEAPALAAANKRVGNILKKSEVVIEPTIDSAKLVEPAEMALAEALAKVKPLADKAFEEGDYTASLQALAALKAPVDDFFDNVMVNADDPALKANRLGLLATLHQAMNRVADLSKLAA